MPYRFRPLGQKRSAHRKSARAAVLRCWILLVGLFSPAYGVSVARAQDAAEAEQAFQRGRSELAAGLYPAACKSFDESLRLDRASGTLLALAYCQELSGLLASASKTYRAAAELAQSEGRLDRRDAANDQYRAVSERASVITVIVPPSLASTPGLRIKLDGVELDREAFGKPIPVDGGHYRIEAAVGGVSWNGTVSVREERDHQTLVVELIPSATSGGSRASAASSQTTPAPPPRNPLERDPKRRALKDVSFGLGVASMAGLGVGLVAALVANGKNVASSRDGHCDKSGCDARGLELRDDALHAARVATWSIVASGVLAAGGLALYWKSRSDLAQTQLGARAYAQGGGSVVFSHTF
jgi:hypothetical protein